MARLVRLFALMGVLALVASACVQVRMEPEQPQGGLGDLVPEDVPEGVEYVGPGAHATTYLRAETPRLVIEVDQASGHELQPSAVDHLRAVLASVLDKPEGIEVRMTGFQAPQRDTWSREQIRNFEDEQRETSTDGGTASMYVLVLNGTFAEAEHVIGVSYSDTSFALFTDRVRESPLDPAAMERSLLVHEAGHLLSLVNIGYTSPRNREDPDHPNHSSNEGSVMHWAVETVSIANLAGGPPDDFDDADRADLEAVKRGDLDPGLPEASG